MKRAFLAAALLSCAAPASAVFLKTQMERIDPERTLDSEYFLDLLGFSEPVDWTDLWSGSTAPVRYRNNSASLDCCDLYIDQELAFEKRLSRGFSFRFRFRQYDDKDRQETHHWLELEKTVAGGFSALLFGEPAFHKEDADIGYGAAWRGGPWSAVLRHTLVDFNFNQRGSSNQRYTRKPTTDELVLGWAEEGDAATLRLELDHPLRREVPAESRVFSYRRTTASAAWRRRPRDSWGWSAGYSYEFERKGDLFNPDPANASLSFQRHSHQGRLAADRALGDKDTLELGQAFLLRAARADAEHAPGSGVFYRRWEAQPYARWRRRAREHLITELGTFLSFGEDRRRSPGGGSPSSFGVLAEAKLGAGVDFLFSEDGRIGVYSSFDVDSAGRHFWDGGNIRALFFF